jgi:hypothetical protein
MLAEARRGTALSVARPTKVDATARTLSLIAAAEFGTASMASERGR